MSTAATAAPAASRGRGRPPVGPRIIVHVDPDVLAAIDAAARAAGTTRAAEVRRRLRGG